MTKLLQRVCLGMAVMAVLAAGFVPAAEAGRLKAQVYMVQSAIPGKLTEKGLLGFAKSHRAKLLRETTGGELNTRKWKGNLIVSFNAPVDDMEFQVLFYDIHDGPRRFVENMSAFVNDSDQRTFVQPFALPRPSFKPNRDMELVVTVRREEVGKLKFGVVGEEKRNSGVVDFSEGG
jgi:hypothetical protein